MVQFLRGAVLIDNQWATYTEGSDTGIAFRGRLVYAHTAFCVDTTRINQREVSLTVPKVRGLSE